MLTNIPAELRELPQWVCANADKEPIDPKTGHRARVDDAATWGTFEQARQRGMLHVGFVLSSTDPFTIIDLDKPENDQQWERHVAILNAIDSYTERSQSGNGYHIIVRGNVPSARRDKVEVYSSLRYMICTGNVVRAGAVKDYQTVLENMVSQMNPFSTVGKEGQPGFSSRIGAYGGLGSLGPGGMLIEHESEWSDAEIAERAGGAVNGEKFLSLWKGEMSEYPSQSEADLALLSILCFYTKDNEQVRRLFRCSRLGERAKAVRDDKYLNYCLKRIRGNELPDVDLDGLAKQIEAEQQKWARQGEEAGGLTGTVGAVPVQQAVSPVVEQVSGGGNEAGEDENTAGFPGSGGSGGGAEGGSGSGSEGGLEFPPNLLGAIAHYIYSAAPRPVKEVAVAGAITLLAGICGRQYNISSTGLNMYTILLARTGTGKEGAASGISKLLHAVRTKVPMVDQFRGPATFASAPAIAKSLVEKPCQFAIMGEFGIWLQDLCDPTSKGPNPMLRRALLDLYQKSGRAQMLMGTEYSDMTKNAQPVESPSLTLLGESTPETFFEGLDAGMLSSGLLPRFLTIEYTGGRVDLNPSQGCEPDAGLVEWVASVAARALQLGSNHNHIDVTQAYEAKMVSDMFEQETTRLINSHAMGSSGATHAEMWNRAHLKALRLAGLYAVADNPDCPTVTPAGMKWAIELVRKDVKTILSRFSTGAVGMGDTKQLAELRDLLRDYRKRLPPPSHKVPVEMHKRGCVPFSYLQRRTASRVSFAKAKMGAAHSLKAALETLTSAGELVELPPAQARKEFNTTQKVFALLAE